MQPCVFFVLYSKIKLEKLLCSPDILIHNNFISGNILYYIMYDHFLHTYGINEVMVSGEEKEFWFFFNR